MTTILTPERLSDLAKKAYTLLGYRTVNFGDGAVGVLGCPSKTIRLMNAFQDLILEAIETAPTPKPSEPSESYMAAALVCQDLGCQSDDEIGCMRDDVRIPRDKWCSVCLLSDALRRQHADDLRLPSFDEMRRRIVAGDPR